MHNERIIYLYLSIYCGASSQFIISTISIIFIISTTFTTFTTFTTYISTWIPFSTPSNTPTTTMFILRHLRCLVHRVRPTKVTKPRKHARRKSLIIEHPPLPLLEWDDDFNLINAPEGIKKMGLVPIQEAQRRERGL